MINVDFFAGKHSCGLVSLQNLFGSERTGEKRLTDTNDWKHDESDRSKGTIAQNYEHWSDINLYKEYLN